MGALLAKPAQALCMHEGKVVGCHEVINTGESPRSTTGVDIEDRGVTGAVCVLRCHRLLVQCQKEVEETDDVEGLSGPEMSGYVPVQALWASASAASVGWAPVPRCETRSFAPSGVPAPWPQGGAEPPVPVPELPIGQSPRSYWCMQGVAAPAPAPAPMGPELAGALSPSGLWRMQAAWAGSHEAWPVKKFVAETEAVLPTPAASISAASRRALAETPRAMLPQCPPPQAAIPAASPRASGVAPNADGTDEYGLRYITLPMVMWDDD